MIQTKIINVFFLFIHDFQHLLVHNFSIKLLTNTISIYSSYLGRSRKQVDAYIRIENVAKKKEQTTFFSVFLRLFF